MELFVACQAFMHDLLCSKLCFSLLQWSLSWFHIGTCGCLRIFENLSLLFIKSQPYLRSQSAEKYHYSSLVHLSVFGLSSQFLLIFLTKSRSEWQCLQTDCWKSCGFSGIILHVACNNACCVSSLMMGKREGMVKISQFLVPLNMNFETRWSRFPFCHIQPTVLTPLSLIFLTYEMVMVTTS